MTLLSTLDIVYREVLTAGGVAALITNTIGVSEETRSKCEVQWTFKWSRRLRRFYLLKFTV